MEPWRLHPLWLCCLWATPPAALARTCLPLAAAIAAAGILWALWRHRGPSLAALPALLAALPAPPLPAPAPAPGPTRITGTVTEVVVDPLAATTRLRLRCSDGTRQVTCDGTLPLLPGDRVQAIARGSEPTIPELPPTLHVPAGGLRVRPGAWSIPRLCAAAHRRLEDALLSLFPGELGPLLCTLTLGRGTRIDDELAAAHRATGVSHLLAVSGAHAAMLAWLLGLQPFGRGPRRRVGRPQAAAALTMLGLYAAITGCEPPVFRALCACAIAVLGQHVGRRASLAAVLGLPALLTALVWPAELTRPSFQLSYAAVVGLWLAGAPGHGRMERWFWLPLRASFWATATTAPFTLFWFQQLAPWTIVLTPLLAPLVGALLIAALALALLACCLERLAALLAPAVGALAELYAFAVTASDALPGTPIHALATPATALLAAAALLALACLLFWRHRRAVAAACALFALPWFLPPLATGPATLRLFAVGHGQAALLTDTDGINVAIDCGSMQRENLPARKLVGALVRRRIDLLILTHGDMDHCSGVAELLRRVPVTHALLPEQLRGSPTTAALAAAGTELSWLPAGTSARPLPHVLVHAPPLHAPSDNDGSLWVRVEVAGTSVLLTGDAEEAGVAVALAGKVAVASDVLVLPHHGRENALAPELLAMVRPSACLVSSRVRDGRSKLGDLAAGLGIPVHTTGLQGDLCVTGGSRPAITSALPAPLVR